MDWIGIILAIIGILVIFVYPKIIRISLIIAIGYMAFFYSPYWIILYIPLLIIMYIYKRRKKNG